MNTFIGSILGNIFWNRFIFEFAKQNDFTVMNDYDLTWEVRLKVICRFCSFVNLSIITSIPNKRIILFSSIFNIKIARY